MQVIDSVLTAAYSGDIVDLNLYGAQGSNTEFHMELWKLNDTGPDAKPQRISGRAMAPETITSATENGHLFYTVPAIDSAGCNRLGLIITRIDTNDSWNPKRYIVLHPDAGAGDSPILDGVEAE